MNMPVYNAAELDGTTINELNSQNTVVLKYRVALVPLAPLIIAGTTILKYRVALVPLAPLIIVGTRIH
jgi:hypothetical protein